MLRDVRTPSDIAGTVHTCDGQLLDALKDVQRIGVLVEREGEAFECPGMKTQRRLALEILRKAGDE
jgi:hypothetical protein